MKPEILSVVETAIYVNDLAAAEGFYAGVLGLPVIRKEPDRHVFFRVGDSDVLLAFLPETAIQGDVLPSHGASGPGHFALGISPASLEDWRQRLADDNVVIEQEVDWPLGGRSIYFRDPAGNAVELITPGVWGLPSGW